MHNRRKFLNHLVTATAGTFLLSKCKNQQSGSKIPEGEEWRSKKKMPVKAGDNYWLTSELEAEANAAIEKYRKGPFTIRLLNQKGEALPGYSVHFRQNGHHFDWGYSGAFEICEEEPLSQQKTKHIKKLFNCTTAKCYWDERWHQPIEHEEGNRIMDRFIGETEWGLANRMKVKGHPLVWTVRKAIPSWMDKYSYEVQLKKLEKHVRELIRAGGDSVTMWDLCNEMLWEPSLRNLPQRHWPHLETIDEILTYLEPAVHWAKDENPAAVYALNDYGLVKTHAPGVTSEQQRKRYVDLVHEMKKRGCAPDAIGTQCHVAGWYSAKEFNATLNDLAMAELPIQVTEFWAHLKDYPFENQIDRKEKEAALVENVKMIYTLAFAHPDVNHFTYWGSREWFDEHANPTSVYWAIHNLIRNHWMTSAEKISDAEGTISLHAFYGTYDVIITDDMGNSHPVSISLSQNNDQLTLYL
jgi:GH35 family endo-1,4-beta-xylanase